MPKLSTRDLAIIAAFEVYESAGEVAAVTGADLRRVIHLQRLYGPIECQVHRRTEDQASLEEARARTAERYNPEPHPMLRKFASPQGRYWAELEAGQGGEVPSGFDLVFETMVAAIGSGRRRRGRGAA